MNIIGHNKEKQQVGIIMSFDEAKVLWHRLNLAENRFKEVYDREHYHRLPVNKSSLWGSLDNFFETELNEDTCYWD